MSVKTLAAAFGLAATTALSGCAVGFGPHGDIRISPAPVYSGHYYRSYRQPVYVQPRVYVAPPVYAPRYYNPYEQPRHRYYQPQPRYHDHRYPRW